MVAFTTESPDDYNSLSIPLQFGKCEVKQCFNVTINDNLKVEPDEEFTLVLESPSHAAIVELNPQIATVTILDDDSESLSFFDTLLNMCFFPAEPIVIGYRPDYYNTTETLGSVELVIEVLNEVPAPWAFNVTVSTETNINFPAIASESIIVHTLLCQRVFPPTVPGVDYEQVDEMGLLFPKGETRIRHSIAIEQDGICEVASGPEENESFLSVIVDASGIGTVDVELPTAQVSIEDELEPECGMWLRPTLV